MINFDEIIERIKSYKNLSHNKEVADIFGISPSDFSLRKKRGTLIPLIVEWAIDQTINLDWLIAGKGDTLSLHKTASNSDVLPYENSIDARHMELVKQFKNKEVAFDVSEKLVRLESLSEGLFKKADSEIEKLIETAEIVLQEQSTNQTGRMVGKHEKKKA